MKTLFKINSFLSLIIFVGILSCEQNDERDYTAPNLDLTPSGFNSEVTLDLNQTTILGVSDFTNAEGNVSYVWTSEGEIISREATYDFTAADIGSFSFNMYAEDDSGKYVNIAFTVMVPEPPHVFDDNKVVAGYIQSHRQISDVAWSEITHLIYSFVYPQDDGTLDTNEMDQLSSFVAAAKENNVKILVSVGGAVYPGKAERVFTSVISDDTKRKTLVTSIDNFVRENELDGIDIDYEELVGGGATVDNTETNKLLPFYTELREALPGVSLISSAVSGGYGWAAYHFRDIAESMSEVLDFISVMSYDNLGTWGGSPLGDHSSLTDAQGALSRYHNDFGVPKNKLVLGVPFYGRDFKTAFGGFAEAVEYKNILASYNPTSDELTLGHINRDGFNLYFNSQERIFQKVEYVKTDGFRGITIWELGQNTNIDSHLSLTNNILIDLE